MNEGKLNEGNNMYDDVLTLKRSFDIFKRQSPDLYKRLDKKFKVKNIQKTLGDMIKFMDTPAAMREGKLKEGKRVTQNMWKKMSDDEKENALLTIFKDPDDRRFEDFLFSDWNKLPGWAKRDMRTEDVDELVAGIPVGASKGEPSPEDYVPISEILKSRFKDILEK